MKHGIDTVRQQRRERQDRHDLHNLQKISDYADFDQATHVDFSHLSEQEIEMTRKNIQAKYRRKRRNYVYLVIMIFGVTLFLSFYSIMFTRIFKEFFELLAH